jgi:putative transcriptional regulator
MNLTPTHHPSPDDLLDYSSGRSDAAARAMVEAHTHLCAACASHLGLLSATGGELLRDLPVTPAPDALLARIMDRLPAPQSTPDEEVPLPKPLQSLLPPASERAWQSALGRGVRMLKVLQQEGVELFLLHLAPGAGFPHHAHHGRECALLLEGGAVVDGARFEAGDWAEFAPGSAHAPKADEEGCWLLVRVEGGVRLSGWRGWLQRMTS